MLIYLEPEKSSIIHLQRLGRRKLALRLGPGCVEGVY